MIVFTMDDLSSTACWNTLAARWTPISLISVSGKVALLASCSSLSSSTRASADLLTILSVTCPVWPRAAPRARPGNMYLRERLEG